MTKKITAGHVVAGLVGAGVSAALASRPTAARISNSENQVKQMEARYDLKKAQLQTAIATTNDRNEEIRHLNELIATYESQVKEMTALADSLSKQERQMQADFGKQMQALQSESSNLKTQLDQKTQNVENLSQINAQYQQELSAARDKITLLEANATKSRSPKDYGMTQWFVDWMKSGGPAESGPAAMISVGGKGTQTAGDFGDSVTIPGPNMLKWVPNAMNHGHPDFTGDALCKARNGAWYRPTSLSDWMPGR